MPAIPGSPPVVVHTGPADRAEAWLAAMRRGGFEVRSLPMIESQVVPWTSDLVAAVAAGAPFGLVVVTSPRAADALPSVASWIGGAQIAAVGAATAKACGERGFAANWVGSGGRRAFLEALAARVDVTDLSVLHPCGDLAEDAALPELAGRGARVVAPVVYRTMPVAHSREELARAAAGAAAVTFTSPSGVRSFMAAADAAGIGAAARLLFAATLGTTTEDAARRAGFRWRGIARKPDPDAVADLLQGALRSE